MGEEVLKIAEFFKEFKYVEYTTFQTLYKDFAKSIDEADLIKSALQIQQNLNKEFMPLEITVKIRTNRKLAFLLKNYFEKQKIESNLYMGEDGYSFKDTTSGNCFHYNFCTPTKYFVIFKFTETNIFDQIKGCKGIESLVTEQNKNMGLDDLTDWKKEFEKLESLIQEDFKQFCLKNGYTVDQTRKFIDFSDE